MKFLSEDQIVDDFYSSMGEVDRAAWRSVAEADLIFAHHGTGRMIRNRYNLWDTDNPHVNANPDHENFPDQISQRIIERVWKLCQSSTSSGAKT